MIFTVEVITRVGLTSSFPVVGASRAELPVTAANLFSSITEVAALGADNTNQIGHLSLLLFYRNDNLIGGFVQQRLWG